MKKDDRARALIQNKDDILLIQRVRAGEIYYVLPGGHIEDGEDAETAVVREVEEETSLRVRIIKKLESLLDKDTTTHHIYLCEYISGVPRLATDSPELTKESGVNVYTPMWKSKTEISDLPMWPAEVKQFLINYFKL
jgi:ADP-ribose pyrophosphatase YjhB (NUDIX family)